MAYARCGDDSDVYVYRTGNIYTCSPSNTSMFHEESRVFTKLSDLKFHLENHIYMGDKVPDYIFERIEKEMNENATN